MRFFLGEWGGILLMGGLLLGGSFLAVDSLPGVGVAALLSTFRVVSYFGLVGFVFPSIDIFLDRYLLD